MMNAKLELLKRVKDNTLERIVREFGKGIGELKNMKLSIWDVRTILYEEVRKQAESIINQEQHEALKEFSV